MADKYEEEIYRRLATINDPAEKKELHRKLFAYWDRQYEEYERNMLRRGYTKEQLYCHMKGIAKESIMSMYECQLEDD
ncbi:MAG: hypothetical protein KKC77_19330 [Proteobacteria bacterium]|nr:hypothetical protein [Pseudomonadota bacterium]